MSELKVEVKASVGNGQTRTKAEAHVVPPVNAILDEIESIKAEQVEQNKAIADNLEEAKKYTDEEIATFDIIKVVNGDPETGLPLVENPLPNRFYLVPKTNTSDKDFFDTYVWANKGTEENPDYVWDFQGTKKVEVDLVEYVKFTDYPKDEKAGVVWAMYSNKGLVIDETTGEIAISGATDYAIDIRAQDGWAKYRPITSDKLDYAAKVGLTTNRLELSDDSTDESGNPVEGDKTKACKWLGASRATNWRNGSAEMSMQNADTRKLVGGKYSIAWNSTCNGKYSFAGGNSGGIWGGNCSFLWGINCGSYGDFAFTFGNSAFAEGTAKKFTFLYGDNVRTAENMSIVFGQYNAYKDETDYLFMLGNGKSDTERNNALIVYKDGHAKFDGTVEVEAPQNDKDTVNKKFAEDNFLAKTTTAGSYYDRVYAVNRDGDVQKMIDVSNSYVANTVAQRTESGTVRTNTPTNEKDAVNKEYAEGKFVAKSTTKDIVYGVDSNGAQKEYPCFATERDPYTIGMRDSTGNFRIAETPAQSYHTASKGYVDGLIAELQAQIDALKGQS